MHTGQGQRRAFVDAAYLGMRVRAAHERCVQHFRQMNVIDELAFAAQESGVFLALDRGTKSGI